MGGGDGVREAGGCFFYGCALAINPALADAVGLDRCDRVLLMATADYDVWLCDALCVTPLSSTVTSNAFG